MFAKVLIANRGEIACRIMATAERLGMATVAVVSKADRGARHAALAGEVREIGPAPAPLSYLAIDKLLAAARETGADCIHPGYGFLAESPEFAAATAGAGLSFIGPPPEALRLMGRKDAAKVRAAEAGVPVIPGLVIAEVDIHGPDLAAKADELGLPLMVKALAGGGGRGMRAITQAGDLADAIESAAREARSAFGDGRLLLEKLITRPRHIEVQIFADRQGHMVHLFERECSLQRRHQKVMEEAPAPGMSQGLRARMSAAAIAAAGAVGYEGAGTVEFLVEGGGLEPDARFYFIEMNARLQVEHRVTEAITGIDLVEWQFRVAAGEPLPLRQDAIGRDGHAIEARLYAENPAHDFRPSTGRLYAFSLPSGEGIRVDTGVREGDVVDAHYDSLLAKLIAHGPNRASALARLTAALEQTLIAGPSTNLAFLHTLLCEPGMREAKFDTEFIARNMTRLTGPQVDAAAVAIGVRARLAHMRREIERRRAGFSDETYSPWSATDAFQLGPDRRLTLPVLVDGAPHEVAVSWKDGRLDVTLLDAEGETSMATASGRGASLLHLDGATLVLDNLRQTEIRWPDFEVAADEKRAGGGGVCAPLTGRVSKLHVAIGDRVQRGAPLLVIEAMKMEHILHAARDGTVAALETQEGAQVHDGALLLRIDDSNKTEPEPEPEPEPEATP